MTTLPPRSVDAPDPNPDRPSEGPPNRHQQRGGVDYELSQARRRLADTIEAYPSRSWPVPLINAVIAVIHAQALPAYPTAIDGRTQLND